MPSPFFGYSSVSSASLTGNAQVDSLLYGTYWSGNSTNNGMPVTSLTYSFITDNSRFTFDYSNNNEDLATYVLTPAQQNSVVSALGAWSSVANIQFTQVGESFSDVGDLRFGGYQGMDDGVAAWAYMPGTSPTAGDVWIGPSTNDPAPVKGSYDYLTFVHEIGHALGLKHPFSTSGFNPTVLATEFDDVRYTVMSYNDPYLYEPTTPMLLDIAAIQSLYGANNQWQTGNNTYSWAAGQSVFETIWDAGGNDTIDASNQAAAVRINLNEGAFSKIGQAFLNVNTLSLFNEGLAIAYGAKIENAVGSAYDDTLIGNALGNTLDGRAGKDTMTGGAGNDTYFVDDLEDIISETSTLASEVDTVRSSVNWSLGTNLENLTLTGTAAVNATGNALGNVLIGNAGNNVLDGGAGNDVLNGVGGIDTLIGGTGSDTYVVDDLTDIISETSTLASEVDTVRSSVDWSLGANLENLTLTGVAPVNATGNALNNVLTGNSGSNVLDGGSGIDTLIGGTGNDTYVVDNLADVISETSTLASEVDTVRSSVDWSLGANLENLTLIGAAAINATGNALGNVLIGNAGNNVLDGGAGNDVLNGVGGIDTLIGGTGSDTYVVDDLEDIISETGTLASEVDTVRSSVNWSLGTNLENLTLTGVAAVNATGNALGNVLIGNAGNNVLDGGAGNDVLNGVGGIDTLIGGTGSDTYVVDDLEDIISETSTLASEVDTVRSSMNWSLGANLENLTLIGAAAVNATGNALNNILTGNAGSNVLDGGSGIDTLIGGTGNDTYVVDNLADVISETSTLASEVDTVRSSVNWSLGTNLENLTLIGAAAINATGNALGNVLIGNAGNNVLDGGAGNDVLNGVGGIDTLIGGTGSDTYVVDDLTDIISETGTLASEVDTVRSSVNWSLGTNLENLTLTGVAAINATGNALGNVLIGNAGNNVLDGGAGNDVLNGVGGIDTLIGGTGSDTYVVDDLEDIISETSTLASEVDTVRSSMNWSLGANLENLILTGVAPVNATGNALNNVLTGNSGSNVLDGGSGIDTLIGGTGNDTYVVDNLADVISETSTLASEVDTVRSSVNWSLGTNLENLTLIGAAAINATGNALGNVLIGNAGNNVLDGGAGNDVLNGVGGIDTLIGGTGSDTYVVDDLTDIISETGTLASEVDTVRSSVNWSLGTNLENLTLTGTAAVNATGNALGNVLIGNAGNNVLDGGAGNDVLNGVGGIDTLIGGTGSDTYVVDDLEDIISETSTLASEVDTVRSSVDWSLGANLENLTLTGAAAVNATGNDLSNVLIGNAGNNVLDGGAGNDSVDGGAGADVLIGGDGADRFVFSVLNELGIGSTRDSIFDFNSLQGDKIDLSKLDASLLTPLNDTFSFIDSADFTGAGQLRFVDHVLYGNVNGDLNADFEIQLLGVNSLSSNDLLA
ncbi:M10 family metallopeptidase C-terminal domain-containing protein [Pseudomonas sp. D1-1]|uniref:M10 family metallopeptidase C-terminal domain-containing protein n=1 Tax=Pseudomonas sp. D1-1 TaxID=1040793 RepID=UPI003DA81588